MISWLTGKEWKTAWDVYAQYTGVNKDSFIQYLEARARRAEEGFDAYIVAHQVCAELQKFEV